MKTKMIAKRLAVLVGMFTLLISISCIGYAIVTEETGEPKEPGLIQSKPGEKQIPQYAPGEVLVKFKEGVDPSSILKEAGIEAQGIERVHSIEPAVAKFRKDYKLEKDAKGGWYSFLGKNYKEVSDIPDEEMFKETYSKMPEVEKALYRSYKVTLPEGMSVEEAVNKLKQDPNVEYVEPNYIVKIQMIPNDPYYSTTGSWGQLYDDLWGIKKLQCEQAWDTSQGDGVVVAVIDTGVDYNHEDLVGNIWINQDEIPGNGIDDDNNGYIDDVRGWDFIGASYQTPIEDNDPMDGYGHGTHVAGTIAAVGNNGLGVIGVAPRAKIMAVKGIDDGGYGLTSGLVNSVRYAAENGAQVINNSWGVYETSRALEDVFNYAHSLRCVSIASAGNSRDDARYCSPANIDVVITVGASDPYDKKVDFSCWGTKVDVVAPGGEDGFLVDPITIDPSKANILSLRAQNTDMFLGRGGYNPGDCFFPFPQDPLSQYYRSLGTSMAAPHVSGLAALIIKNLSFSYSPEEVKHILRSSADDVELPGWDIHTGYGRINARKALEIQSAPQCYISSPTPNQTLKNRIDVTGTAYGEGESFMSYRLEYAFYYEASYYLNLAPISFIPIGGIHTTPVQNGVLENWDIRGIDNGHYLLRLVVTDRHGHNFYYHTIVKIGNHERQNWPVEFTPVDDPEYPKYELANIYAVDEIIVDEIDQTYPGEEIVIAAIGQGRVKSTGQWSPYKKALLYIFHSDGTVATGWPFIFNNSNTINTPTLADIDNDKEKEVIVSVAGGIILLADKPTLTAIDNFPKIYVFNKNGLIESGWPQELRQFTDGSIGVPVVADLNPLNEGQEVVVTGIRNDAGNTYAAVFDYRGVMLSGWPIFIDEANHIRAAAVGDIDTNFPGKEIVFLYGRTGAGQSPWLRVYPHHYDGSLVPGVWPVEYYGHAGTNIVLGDIDGDGVPEILTPDVHEIYAWRNNGTLYPGFPLGLDAWQVNLILGNLDMEGSINLATGTQVTRNIKGGFFSEAFICDLSGPKLGWPKEMLGREGASSIGDINGDGEADIVFTTDGGGATPIGEIYAWKKDGERLMRWRYLAVNNSHPNIFRNANKQVSMAMNINGKVYIWDFEHNYHSYTMEWPMYHHDAQRTGCYKRPNQPPKIDPPIGDKEVNEGSLLEFTVQATDPDGDALTYSATNLPTGATFNPTTKTFTWTPDYDQAGIYGVIFTVSDDGGLTDSETITITVNNVNRPPVLDPIGNKTTAEGKILEFKVTASDPDGDILAYSAEGLPQGAAFANQVFTWTPDYKQAGTYDIKFTVSDGNLSTSESIVITVINVNRPPVLSPIGNKTGQTGKELSFYVTARDLDGDRITMSAIGLPLGAKFEPAYTIPPYSGTATYIFRWVPYDNQAGDHRVTFIASDGSDKASETIVITIKKPARPIINAIKPSFGAPGSSIGVYGKGFGAINNSSHIYFYYYGTNKIAGEAAIAIWTDTYIKCTVPNLKAGRYTVRAATSSGLSNGVNFTVMLPTKPSAPSAGTTTILSRPTIKR